MTFNSTSHIMYGIIGNEIPVWDGRFSDSYLPCKLSFFGNSLNRYRGLFCALKTHDADVSIQRVLSSVPPHRVEYNWLCSLTSANHGHRIVFNFVPPTSLCENNFILASIKFIDGTFWRWPSRLWLWLCWQNSGCCITITVTVTVNKYHHYSN